MKKSIYILIAVLTVSCSNLLDKLPLHMISDATVWNDPILIQAYLTETWADTYILVNEVNNNQITEGKGWFEIVYPNKIGRETFTNWGGNINHYINGNLNVGGGLLEWWERSYAIIRKLNEFIERLPDTPLDDDTKALYIADARWLRAYNYFAMVKRYGGVPIILQAQDINDPEEELFRTRDKEEDVYNFVIKEMDEIMNDLPQHKAAVRYGKPTKYTALALKCRAALYAGSIARYGRVQLGGVVGIDAGKADSFFNTAFTAASEIIQSGEFWLYEGNPDKTMNFREIFTTKNNSEVLLAVIHDGINSQQGGNGWGWDFINTPMPNGVGAGNADGVYLEVVEDFEYIDGRPGKLDRDAITAPGVLWDMDELWRDKDPRFFASVYTQGMSWKGAPLQMYNGIITLEGEIQTTSTYQGILCVGEHQHPGAPGFGILKLLDESHDNTIGWGTSETDWIVFRYAEVLLNYAEAALETGKKQEALDAVNLIRRRAGIKELGDITMADIRHERKVELLFEGHRYWDARRWRVAVDELSFNGTGLRYILDYATGKYKLELFRDMDGTASRPLFLERHYYLPITLGRTGNNPRLVENPGYQQ